MRRQIRSSSLGRQLRFRRGYKSTDAKRLHFFEQLEPRQLLASVPVALNDPRYATDVGTDLEALTKPVFLKIFS